MEWAQMWMDRQTKTYPPPSQQRDKNSLEETTVIFCDCFCYQYRKFIGPIFTLTFKSLPILFATEFGI